MFAKNSAAGYLRYASRRTLWWIVVAALLTLSAAKLGLMARLATPELEPELDAKQYFELGGVVAGGDWWLRSVPIAYRTPVYPWLVGFARSISDSPIVVMVWIQCLLQWLTPILAGILAMQLCGPLNRGESGSTVRHWIVPLVMLLMLPAISSATYVTVLLTESVFTVLLLLHLISVLAFFQDAIPNRTRYVAAMTVAATLIATLLTRPIVLLIWVPHAVLWLSQVWKDRPRRLSDRWGELATMAILAVVLISPWWMRNQELFGEGFVTKFVGRNLWIVTFAPGSGSGLAIAETDQAQAIVEKFGVTVAQANAEPVSDASTGWRHTWSVHAALAQSGQPDPAIDD